MKKQILCLALAVVLILGLAAPAVAYGTPDFSDLPADNWAYGPVMRMADQGIIQGTGGGLFSPELKVSVAQFLTLVGRIVFPETKVNEGETWYGPHVAACQKAGFLTGTQVNASAPEAEITRYDMAVILRAAAKKLGKTETLAQQSQVTDYGMVPTMYADAVLAVYGMGLITGDQNGNFNGANTMQRNELATVIDRLVALKAPNGTTNPGATTDPEKPEESEKPTETEQPTNPPVETQVPEIVTARVWHSLYYYPTQGKASWYGDTTLVGPDVPFKIFYTEDNGETSTLIAESKTEGTGQFTLEFPLDKRLIVNPNGQFYISARFEKDGQTFVTQDLRTDGRKALSLVHVFEKGNGVGGGEIELVPPTGQKWEFDLKGKVPSSSTTPSGEEPFEYLTVAPNGDISPAGFTVQLVYYPEPNLQDGIPTGERVVISETKSDEEGKFVLHVSLDTLDRVTTESFRIEMRGVSGGKTIYSWEKDKLVTLGRIKDDRTNAARDVLLEHDR